MKLPQGPCHRLYADNARYVNFRHAVEFVRKLAPLPGLGDARYFPRPERREHPTTQGVSGVLASKRWGDDCSFGPQTTRRVGGCNVQAGIPTPSKLGGLGCRRAPSKGPQDFGAWHSLRPHGHRVQATPWLM